MKVVPTDTKVQIKWFVYAGKEKIRYNASMRGTWGFDAECSCGWESRTGGGVRSYVADEIENHKRNEHNYKWDFQSKAGA